MSDNMIKVFHVLLPVIDKDQVRVKRMLYTHCIFEGADTYVHE